MALDYYKKQLDQLNKIEAISNRNATETRERDSLLPTSVSYVIAVILCILGKMMM